MTLPAPTSKQHTHSDSCKSKFPQPKNPPLGGLYRLSAILLFTMFGFSSFAQDPVREVNLELRHFFSQLVPPQPQKDFLYDMSAKMTDSSFYSCHAPDTVSNNLWYRLYEEMWWAAYDTTTLPKVEAAYDLAQRGGDTIAMGIMAFDFWKLKSDALNTLNYFDFDTINHWITDKAGRTSTPYLDSCIFSSCALKNQSFFANPVFRIDPALIFNDSYNTVIFSGGIGPEIQFQVDFDDGVGFRVIDPSQLTHHNVSYTTNGKKSIVTRVISYGTVLVKSTSSILVLHDFDRPQPDEIWDLPGLRAAIFRGCESTGEMLSKPIVLIEGLDYKNNLKSDPGIFDSNRDFSDFYTQIVLDQNMADLRNYNYDIVVVDWDNSLIDMRQNAAFLTYLIEELKAHTDDEDQLVVMGTSMGSIIARVCMTFMESDLYQNNDISLLHDNFFLDNWNRPHLMHKVRTYISHDGAMQGVNISMAYQKAYDVILDHLAFTSTFGIALKKEIEEHKRFLGSEAAKQLMIYHLDTESGLSEKLYTHHSARDAFLEYFNEPGIKAYPEYCKKVAIANGSFNGIRQRNFYYNTERITGDRLLDMVADVNVKLFGIFRIPLMGMELKLYTNCPGSRFLFVSSGHYTVRIRPKLKLGWPPVEIKMDVGYISNGIKDYELDPEMRSLCTEAGGWIGPATPLFATNDFKNVVIPFHAYFELNQGNGCLSSSYGSGTKYVATVDMSLNVCTDGVHFCHVPTYSALDLPGAPANVDVSDNTVAGWFNQTPFDVIISSLASPVSRNPNRFHRDINNNIVQIGDEQWALLENCKNGEDVDSVRLINREIGEETIYVNNLVLPRPARFSALFDLVVDDINPFYNTATNSNGFVPGTYSRENPLSVIANPINGTLYPVTFHTGIGSSTNGPGFFPPLNANYNWNHENSPYMACCVDYYHKDADSDQSGQSPKKFTEINLYPNPAVNHHFHLLINLEHPTENFSLYLYDTSGKQVMIEQIDFGKKVVKAHISQSLPANLPAGIYSLVIKTIHQTAVKKLIVHP